MCSRAKVTIAINAIRCYWSISVVVKLARAEGANGTKGRRIQLVAYVNLNFFCYRRREILIHNLFSCTMFDQNMKKQ